MELINLKNKKSFSSDFLAITSEKGNVLIDAGFYNEEVKEVLKKLGTIDAILLTHGHWDHIQVIDEIKIDYPYLKVYIYENDYKLLKDEELNLSLKHRCALKVESEVVQLKEESFKIAGYDINLIATPGHTGGSCLYYFKNEEVLFTGDTIGPEVIGNSYYPTGSDKDMYNSLIKFKNLNLPKETMCYSSHWGVGSYEEILKTNPYLEENFLKELLK